MKIYTRHQPFGGVRVEKGFHISVIGGVRVEAEANIKGFHISVTGPVRNLPKTANQDESLTPDRDIVTRAIVAAEVALEEALDG